MYYDNSDDRWAHAQKQRQKILGTATNVTFTARQTVYCIWDFKTTKEKKESKELSSLDVATFWKEKVMGGNTNGAGETLHKPTTIDVCITVKTRFYAIGGVEQVVQQSEAMYGSQSVWNNLYALREILLRCKSPKVIEWFVYMVDDELAQGHIEAADITSRKIQKGASPVGVEPLLPAARQGQAEAS